MSMVPQDGQGAWTEAAFGGEAPARWKMGVLEVGAGAMLSGVRWEGELPVTPYEIELEAQRTSGADFFCGLTVPVRGAAECVTWIVGGWGGMVVGISSIDGYDASENETTNYMEFDNHRWYRLRMAVRRNRLSAWIDGEPVVDVDTTSKELGLRPGEIEMSAPLGLATWQTAAGIRNVRWRRLPE